MKRHILLLWAFAAITIPKAEAQIFTQVIDEEELQFKVKLIDEFFQRFNYETDYKGNPIIGQKDSISSDSVVKRKNLMTLFNLDTFMNDKKELDSISSGFLDYVMSHNKRIHYADTTWCAEAIASVVINKKSYPISIFLQTEHVKDVIYKWVITDIESPLFSQFEDSVETNVAILPGAHGSSFITLPETVNLNAHSVKALFHKGYKPSTLSVFGFLVSCGMMKLKQVTKVTYHFRIDEYKFKVERFEKKNSYNKGWLISEIIKTKDTSR